jgi:hypothetical protein
MTDFYPDPAVPLRRPQVLTQDCRDEPCRSETVPRVMATAVHPLVTGQPHRIGALDAALEYICSHAGVWRATGWEIVQHFLVQQR